MRINGHVVAEGTVICRTLRTEYLMRAFRDEIRRLSTRSPDCCWSADAWLKGKEAYQNDHGVKLDEDEYQEDGSLLVSDLMEHLNSMAPTGYYFGAHEGDGADFGWWRNSDAE